MARPAALPPIEKDPARWERASPADRRARGRAHAADAGLKVMDSEWLIMNARGFASEAGARQLGHRLKSAVEVSPTLVRYRSMADVDAALGWTSVEATAKVAAVHRAVSGILPSTRTRGFRKSARHTECAAPLAGALLHECGSRSTDVTWRVFCIRVSNGGSPGRPERRTSASMLSPFSRKLRRWCSLALSCHRPLRPRTSSGQSHVGTAAVTGIDIWGRHVLGKGRSAETCDLSGRDGGRWRVGSRRVGC
jgi:hypothetical protein